MSKDIIVIYHGNCADGFGAAWSVRHAIGEDGVEYYPGVYQHQPPDVKGKRVIFVDFSYKKAVIEKMAETAKSILIIDHHASAQEDLVGFTDHKDQQGGWLPSAGVWVLFDMKKSGAMLAWEYFNPGEEPPALIKHIQDRDLWKFELTGTEYIQAALFSYPYDFNVWDDLMLSPVDSLYEEGGAITRKHHKDIAELLAVCKRTMNIGGHTVPVASLPYTMGSDAGHIMAQGQPFSACYWDTAETRIFGLRSTKGVGMNVKDIALQYGGGGHENAAGFSVPRTHDLAKS